MEESGKGSISTKARTNNASGTRIYCFDKEGQIVPDEDLPLAPEGTEIRILTSLDQDGNPTGWGQYLTENTVWVQCEVVVEGQNYYGWLIRMEDISFDPRLTLPSMWTEG